MRQRWRAIDTRAVEIQVENGFSGARAKVFGEFGLPGCAAGETLNGPFQAPRSAIRANWAWARAL
jgi:hypothetical protein